MTSNLLHNVDIAVVEASASAGQTTLTTDVVDMAAHRGVAFIAHLGDVTAGSVLGFAIDHSDNGVDGWVELDGALAFTAGASDADNKVLVIDVIRPERRYLRARLLRGTQNAVVNGITAIRYGGMFMPVTQGATVLASATLANPTAA